MRVAVLSSDRGWHTSDLIRALEARGHYGAFLPIRALSGSIGRSPRLSIGATTLEEFDAVLVRTIPLGSLEQIVFRIDALHRLERLGVRVINPARVIERTVDKFYTSALLEEAGVLTPATVVAQTREEAMEAFREMGDVIVKPLFGSNGRGIVRVTDEEIAHRVFRALELERAVFYLQQAIPHEGRDLRVFVLGGRILAAMWRSAPGWRTNLSRGGEARAAELTPAWERLALSASEVVGADYAGVDLLPTPEGDTHVLEVNGSPGWRGLQPVSGIDIADALVAHLEALVGRAAPP
jgi:RimK family alpha-L-glutamate ligase